MSLHHVPLGGTHRASLGTADDTGAAANADSTPVVVVLSSGGALAYSPTVTNITTGLYEVAIVCSTANGFVEGQSYSAYVTVVSSGITGRDGLTEFIVRASNAVLLGDVYRACFGTAGSSGAVTNADSLPTVVVLEQGTALAYAPTVTNIVTGLYEVVTTLSAANGFEQGKEYTAYVTAAVASITGRDEIQRWRMRADFATASTATTNEAIRDRVKTLIEAITPSVDTDVRFLSYRNEERADFRAWADKSATAAHRRFQARFDRNDEMPEVSDTLTDLRHVTLKVLVAYPQTGRYGTEGALDRDDVIDSDWGLINGKIGIYGRGNFTAAGGNDCTPLGAEMSVIEGEGCDFMEITARYSYWRTVT